MMILINFVHVKGYKMNIRGTWVGTPIRFLEFHRRYFWNKMVAWQYAKDSNNRDETPTIVYLKHLPKYT